jgi:hypothetical protein
MPVLVLIVLFAWLLVAMGALTVCAAARRTDGQIAQAELAPVIDLEAAALASRQHSAA